MLEGAMLIFALLIWWLIIAANITIYILMKIYEKKHKEDK